MVDEAVVCETIGTNLATTVIIENEFTARVFEVASIKNLRYDVSLFVITTHVGFIFDCKSVLFCCLFDAIAVHM